MREQRTTSTFSKRQPATELSPGDIRRIAKYDHDRPSLFPYFLLVAFFVLLNAAYYFFWFDVSRPVWEPVVKLGELLWGFVR